MQRDPGFASNVTSGSFSSPSSPLLRSPLRADFFAKHYFTDMHETIDWLNCLLDFVAVLLNLSRKQTVATDALSRVQTMVLNYIQGIPWSGKLLDGTYRQQYFCHVTSLISSQTNVEPKRTDSACLSLHDPFLKQHSKHLAVPQWARVRPVGFRIDVLCVCLFGNFNLLGRWREVSRYVARCLFWAKI